MKIKRFVAKDMRTALTQIKEELGADAVIMSNKKIPEGVELMAAIDYEQTPAAKAAETTNQEVQLPDDKVSLSAVTSNKPADTVNPSKQMTANHKPASSLAELLNRDVQKQASSNNQKTNVDTSISQQLKNFTDRLQQNSPQAAAVAQSVQTPVTDSTGDDLTDGFNQVEQVSNDVSQVAGLTGIAQQEMAQLKQEMASIRQILQHQVSGLMWQDMAQKDPSRALLIDHLTHLGLSDELADRIAGYVPSHLSEQQSFDAALDMLSTQLNTTNNDIIQRGGVVALVGPTGVGKTTSIAKLAARFSQIHGKESVALISTDTFRIAGFEQLQTYGKIIGCPVKLAQNAEQLAQYLAEFHHKKLVLIDTAGMGQRDLRLVEHLATLIADSRVRIRNYLVLAANAQYKVLQENVERFKKIPLAGCIFTKLDESISVGEIISIAIQNGLPIGYLTDGQRVPEDIKVANAKKLVMLANRLADEYTLPNLPVWQMNNVRASAHVV